MKAIDFYCGGGGSSAGAREGGFKMIGAVDAWDVAAQTYADNFPTAKVIANRLHSRSKADIFGNIAKVDLLLASPECTSHSVARGSKPADERSRQSSWHVLKYIREYSPRWIVLENVNPMRRWHGFDYLIEHLKKSHTLSILTLDAADFGVPQNRRRLFIVGDRLVTPKIAKPNQKKVRTASSILDRKGTYNAAHAIHGRASGTVARIKRGIRELGKGKDFIVVYYGSDKAGGWQRLDRPLRTLTTLDRFGLVQWQDGEPTLRMLQVPELKRAMGLENLTDQYGKAIEFKLNFGSRRDKIKILGNGVCAPVMKCITASLLGGNARDALSEFE